MNQKLTLTILVVVLLAAGGMAYYATILKDRGIPESTLDGENSMIPPLESAESGKAGVADWKTYQNEEYRFKFQYPPELDSLPLKGGARENQIEAWTIKDEYNNDQFYLVLSANNLSSFKYVDYTSGGKYIFDPNKKTWSLSLGVNSADSDQEYVKILRNLTPNFLNLRIEAYKDRGGSGYCVWD